MHEHRVTSSNPQVNAREGVEDRRAGGASWRDRAFLTFIRLVAGRLQAGRFCVTAPGGASATISGLLPGKEVRVGFSTYGSLYQALSRGKLGFAEAYMDGSVDVSDLHSFFHFILDNEAMFTGAGRLLARASRGDRSFHRWRDNTRSGSRRNIAAHYDLGNDFYRLWLDEGMTYSSGIHASASTSLEDAQAAKITRVMEALELRAGHRLLEIGCGWGSFIEAAARHGAVATGITISTEQFGWARDRVERAMLASGADIRFIDYRDVAGSFDRIASIEMIEAVGEAHWPEYFGVIAERLAPGGVGVIQAITIPERFCASYHSSPDFIQRYIFPGGMLPTVEAMEASAKANGLAFEGLERFGASYALTLHAWRARFHAAWPMLRQLGYDERFRRMWDYYLAYCAAGFEHGTIDVGLYRVRKPV